MDSNNYFVFALKDLLEKVENGECIVTDFNRESTQIDIIENGSFVRYESGLKIEARYILNDGKMASTMRMPKEG